MAKTKRAFILASSFVSVAAAILSFVSLGTEGWITTIVVNGYDNNSKEKDSISMGLFSGVFVQTTAQHATYQLTTVCNFDLNICALLCGENMDENLKKLYYHQDPIPMVGDETCAAIYDSFDYHAPRRPVIRQHGVNTDRVFINAGIWVCTICFVVLSGIMGIISAVLALWNSASTPSQPYLRILGLYISNSVAFFSILFAIVFWAGMYLMILLKNIPTYKTFLDGFSTDGYARLGYSYWLNLGSLFLYIVSLSLLYYRDYLISKEPKVATDEAEIALNSRGR